MKVLREVLVFGQPGTYQFRPRDYPWLTDVAAYLKGGGSEHGYVLLELYGPPEKEQANED